MSICVFFQESYEALPIEQKVNILLGAISNVAEIPEEGRQLSAVMLRRLFSSEFDEFFGKVSKHMLTIHYLLGGGGLRNFSGKIYAVLF